VLLTSGKAEVEIDPKGAYVTRWAVDGRDILYPKSELKNSKGESKTRGGCHVCLPNFDNGDKYGLPHHGYGRLVDWRVVSQSASSLALEIDNGDQQVPEKYHGLKARLVYTLEADKLTMLLWVKNAGDAGVEVDPAFHPYFLNDAPLYELSPMNLPVTLVWSDNLDNYFCAEPTANGRSFKDSVPNVLEPGEEKSYSLVTTVLK
jgi:D-hexose-6-phosphate mutarotase